MTKLRSNFNTSCLLLLITSSAWQSIPFVPLERQWLCAALRRAVRLTLAFRTSNSVTRVSLCREYKRPIAIARSARSIERNFNFETVTRSSSLFLVPAYSLQLFPFCSVDFSCYYRTICTICAPGTDRNHHRSN